MQYEYEDDPVESVLIEDARDLYSLARLARDEQLVLVLAFTTDWCEYCEALEQQVLEPMIINGDFEGKALVRKILVDDVSSIRDFDGEQPGTSQFAIRYGVNLYPTVLFVDANGNELTQRIVGITVLEFAADTISKSLQQATDRLKPD